MDGSQKDNPYSDHPDTELLQVLDETEIKANGVVRCLARYYFEFLQPRGIPYHTRCQKLHRRYERAADAQTGDVTYDDFCD